MTGPTEIVEISVDKKQEAEGSKAELSACHRVFGTTELLEKILLQLDRPEKSKENPLEPVIQLFVLKRVSQQFRDVIKGSTLLWDKMSMPAVENMGEFDDACEIEELVDLAGPKIAKAYRREKKGQSWRNMYVLHENADPISVYVYSDALGERFDRAIDSVTTYADLLDIDAELQAEAEMCEEDDAALLEEYADEIRSLAW